MRLGRLITALLAAALLAAAVVLAFDNLSVDVAASDLGQDGPAGEVGCVIAPWDAVLNDNDGRPGGEHSREFGDEVASECFAASTARFRMAVGVALLGLVACVLAIGVGARRVAPDEVDAGGAGRDDADGRR